MTALPRLLASVSVVLAVACDDSRVPVPGMPPPARDATVVTPSDDAAVINPGDDASQPTESDAGVVINDDAAAAPDAMAPQRNGVGVLGYETHAVGEVEWTVLASNTPRRLFRTPRDLEFLAPGELWIVNRGDDSTVTIYETGTAAQTELYRRDPFAEHFMEEVSSISMGAMHATYGRTFGTCQESNNTYNGQAAPNNFMGPSLWPSAPDVYARTNREAEQAQGFDLGSHLDMLHQSPLCMGIQWDHDNVYWTFDGLAGSISRYDFQADHAPGYDDHSDGIIARYGIGSVRRVADVPSHLELDRATNRLFIADTGNARIAVLDTTSGTPGNRLVGIEPGVQFFRMNDANLTTFVETAAGELVRPSGMVLVGDVLFVTDNGNGRITAFDKNTGARLDYLETGLPAGALMGITADEQGRLYITDAIGNQVIRIAAKS